MFQTYIAPVIWVSGLIRHTHRVIVPYNCYCREMLMLQKAKVTGWLQYNNNSDMLNAGEKQLPWQQARPFTVPTAEENAMVGNHKTKQPTEKCRDGGTGQELCAQICLLTARLPGIEQPSRDSPAGTVTLRSNTVSPVPHEVNGFTFPPGILCLWLGEMVSSLHTLFVWGQFCPLQSSFLSV